MRLWAKTGSLSGKKLLGLLLLALVGLAALSMSLNSLFNRPAAPAPTREAPSTAVAGAAVPTATVTVSVAPTQPVPPAGFAVSQPPPPKVFNPQLPLEGRRIGLDPGHGPRGDMGAVVVDPSTGRLVLSEAEFDLDVALRTRSILQARGANVVLTRETADTFTAPWPVDANGDGIVGGPKDDLQERVDILNNFHAEAFISIHANNAPGARSLRGVQAYYCSSSDCPLAAQSKRLGNIVLDQLQAKLVDAGYPPQSSQLHSDTWVDGLHIFLLGPVNPPTHVRATRMPGVLSETLYMTSPADTAELTKDSVRQAIALAYADALQDYFTGQGQ